jgi:hypothetical protein
MEVAWSWRSRKGIPRDGAKFADAWRAGYGPSMNRVRTGELPWTRLDDLHRMTLDRILTEFKMAGLTDAEKDTLNRAWHRLRPWPDSVAGLSRLKKAFIIAPLSNGNISLMTDMAKHAGLPGTASSARSWCVITTGSRGLPVGRRTSSTSACRRDDGRRAPGRSSSGEKCGASDRVRRPAARVRARRKAGPERRRVGRSVGEDFNDLAGQLGV